MYLLDTDVLIWVLRGREDITRKVLTFSKKAPLALSVITIAEIYKNIFPSEMTTVEDYLADHIIIDVDIKIAKTAGFYWQEYSKKLKNLSLTDCLIAATANVDSFTLVTLNAKHFPMKDIKVLDPLLK